MTKIKKRALELLHLGYFDRRTLRRHWPKWKQAYAIAVAEDRKRQK